MQTVEPHLASNDQERTYRSHDAATEEAAEFPPRKSSPTPSDQMSRKTHNTRSSKKLISSLKLKYSHDRTTKGNTESWGYTRTVDPTYSITELPKISSFKNLKSKISSPLVNHPRNASCNIIGTKIVSAALSHKAESFEICSNSRVKPHLQKAVSLPGDQNHVDSFDSNEVMSGEEEHSIHFEPESVPALSGTSPRKPDLLSPGATPTPSQNHRTSSSSEDALKPVIVRESTFKIKETFELAAESGDMQEMVTILQRLLAAKKDR